MGFFSNIGKLISALASLPSLIGQVMALIPQILAMIPSIISLLPKLLELVPKILAMVPDILQVLATVMKLIPSILSMMPHVLEVLTTVAGILPTVIGSVVKVIKQVGDLLPKILPYIVTTLNNIISLVNKLPEVINKFSPNSYAYVALFILSYVGLQILANNVAGFPLPDMIVYGLVASIMYFIMLAKNDDGSYKYDQYVRSFNNYIKDIVSKLGTFLDTSLKNKVAVAFITVMFYLTAKYAVTDILGIEDMNPLPLIAVTGLLILTIIVEHMDIIKDINTCINRILSNLLSSVVCFIAVFFIIKQVFINVLDNPEVSNFPILLASMFIMSRILLEYPTIIKYVQRKIIKTSSTLVVNPVTKVLLNFETNSQKNIENMLKDPLFHKSNIITGFIGWLKNNVIRLIIFIILGKLYMKKVIEYAETGYESLLGSAQE